MNLHKEFVKLSFDIIKMKNKLMSLLLEIYEKEIFKEHNCRTIYEYGFKYAKLSKETIDKALRTLKHLEHKPALKKIIEKEGIHKVALVATISTPENESTFAKHVENMSKAALFEFAKEIRNQHGDEQKCHAIPGKIKVEFDDEMQIIFLQLKKELGLEISNKEALKIILKKFTEIKSAQCVEVKQHAGTNSSKEGIPNSIPGNGTPATRYIEVSKKREILNKFNHKCAYPNCQNPHDVLHHRDRFSLRKSHESLVPLCKQHHEFAHNGLIGNEMNEPEKWNLQTDGKIKFVDQLFLQYSRR